MHSYARDEVGADENINVISTDKNRKLAEDLSQNYHTRPNSGLLGWHTDISYEPVPSDYTTLRLTQLPRTGGGNNNFPRPLI
jgi:alpha-ketoglutarate-dependent taurine dioxygenase